jgi:DNA-binding NtrC family response regulator
MHPTRILIENHDIDVLEAQVELFRAAGFVTVACGGPHSLPGDGCPLTTDLSCPLVDFADAVFFDLDLDDADEATVLDHIRALHPGLPVVVEIPNSTARRHADRLEGCTIVPPFDVDRLLSTINAAAAPN